MKKNLCRYVSILSFIITTLLFGDSLPSRDAHIKNIIQEIDGQVESLLESMNVPGCAIGVIVDGESVLKKGYGLRNVEHVLPITTETLFQVGSATKAFTSFLLGKLVDDGLLHWDDPVSEHIPYFRLKDPYTTYQVSIRDYLTHTSGYPKHDAVWFNLHLSREDVIKKLRYLESVTSLRESFIYQNIGYMIAGHVAENVTGKSFEELIQTYIFNPLEMHTSTFSLKTMQSSDDYSLGYREKNKEVFSTPTIDPITISPAGGIHSNLDDMVKWVKALLNKGQGLISESSLKEIFSPQVVSHFITRGQFSVDKEVPMESYGLGWMIIPYRGHFTVLHGGNIEGFSSIILLLPKDNIGIVILTNKHNTPLPYLLSTTVVDRLLNLDPIDWIKKYKDLTDYAKDDFTKKQEEKKVHRHENTEPSHPIMDFKGTYSHPGYGSIEVEVKQNRLIATYNNMHLYLNHWHYDVFEISEETGIPVLEGIKVSFHENTYGDIDSLTIPFEPSSTDIAFVKEKDVSLFGFDYLDRFVGNYSYHGFTFCIDRNEDKLVVKAMGQPPFELSPERDNLFKIKGFDGYTVQFLYNDDGGIIAVQLVQPNNAVFTAYRS